MHTYGGLTPLAIDGLTMCDFYLLCEWAENQQLTGEVRGG